MCLCLVPVNSICARLVDTSSPDNHTRWPSVVDSSGIPSVADVWPTSGRSAGAHRSGVFFRHRPDVAFRRQSDVFFRYWPDVGKTRRIYEHPLSGKTSVRRRILMGYQTSYRRRADLFNSRRPDVCLWRQSDVFFRHRLDVGKTRRIYEQPMSGKTSVRRRILLGYLTSYWGRADLLNSRPPDVLGSGRSNVGLDVRPSSTISYRVALSLQWFHDILGKCLSSWELGER